jgi:DNA repair exonuclease SbcCD nuclease subunit
MKILLFSDIHIHSHKKSLERLDDCLSVLDWVFQLAVDRQIQHVVFLGDLFHERHKIDVLSYQRTFEIFDKYMSRNAVPLFKLYLLLGNHDLWHLQKWDVSSVFPLGSISGVHVISYPCTELIGKYPISFLPYTDNPIETLKQIKNDAEYKILMGHCAVDGGVLNSRGGHGPEVTVEHDGNMVRVDTKVFKDWNQVFLGHYHEQQKINNVEYIGSPLELSFGEAFSEKHVIIYDLETHEKEYVENTFSPKHLIIPQKDLDKYDLSKNFIRLMVDDISQADITEVRSKVLSENKPGSFEIRQSDKDIDENFVNDAKAILFKEHEMLEKYIQVKESEGELGLDKEKLLQIGRAICSKESNGTL